VLDPQELAAMNKPQPASCDFGAPDYVVEPWTWRRCEILLLAMDRASRVFVATSVWTRSRHGYAGASHGFLAPRLQKILSPRCRPNEA